MSAPSDPGTAAASIAADLTPGGGDARIAGSARCASCAALLDGDGRCWACAPSCSRCAARGDLVAVADSAGSGAGLCVGCGAAWLDTVAGDFDASVGVFAGTASAVEIAEHDRAVADRQAAAECAAEKKAAATEARLRKLAEQVDAVVAIVEAAGGPVRKKAVTMTTPFGVNATEAALSSAVKAGRVRVGAQGYYTDNAKAA